MARIIYSALVESIQGSIKGTTFQRNAYGYTVKGKPNMVNPNTPRQNARKQTFSSASQAWRSLTSGERAEWDAYANAFPIPSKKNPSAYLSGLAAFTRWHGVDFQLTDTVLGSPSGAQGTAFVDQYDIIRSGANLFASIPTVTTEGPWNMFLYMTRPLSPSQSFLKSWARFIYAEPKPTWDDPNVASRYISVFGALPAVGALVGVQMVFVNSTNGQVLFGAAEVVEVQS